MKSWRVILIFFIFCNGTFLLAQSDCSGFVEEANELYNTGNYDDCIQVLEDGLARCPSFFMTKNRREKAYVLLINSNLEKDSLQAVDKYFRKLLNNNPDFKKRDYDEIDDFERNLNNYYVIPRLSLGMRVMWRSPSLDFTQSSDSLDGLTLPASKKLKKGFSASFMVDYRITNSWTQFSEIGYYALNYEIDLQNSKYKKSIEENSNFVQWDIGTKYYYNPRGKFNPYFAFGMSNQFLTTSKLRVVLKETITDSTNITHEVVHEEKVDSRKIRNSYVPYAILGTGFLIKRGKIGYGIDYRLYQPLGVTINDQKNRDALPLLKTNVNYVDSNIRMNRHDWSFIIVYMFNNVKKKPVNQE